MTITLAAVAAALFGCGTWMLLQRRLSRIIIGLGLLGHGANLLLVTAGGLRGLPPIVGSGASPSFSDPLPHALALTAIVITFGVTAFLLALGFRSWQLTRDDRVEDDVEDRFVARAVLADEAVADAAAAELPDVADAGGGPGSADPIADTAAAGVTPTRTGERDLGGPP